MVCTNACYCGIWERYLELEKYDRETRFFWITYGSHREYMYVESFENGIAVVEPTACCHISDFAEMIAGCFHEDSNFASELFKAFECDENTTLKGIQFDFNGANVLVTKENADTESICSEWEKLMDALEKKYLAEREAYMKTPEYRAKRAKELKFLVRKKRVQQEVLAIDESTDLEFKDEEAKANWESWFEGNSNDYYSYCVVKYARCWAKYMQHLMKKHKKSLEEIAGESSRMADVEGITGFQYGCAVSGLSQFWKYGDDLRRWHNKQYGCAEDNADEEGVINPAILTVEVIAM